MGRIQRLVCYTSKDGTKTPETGKIGDLITHEYFEQNKKNIDENEEEESSEYKINNED